MAIELHDLKPAPGAHKAKTRVGRGEGSKGKTAGRGTKGTGARKNVPEFFAGGQMPIHMQAPKLGGFHNPFRTEYQVVNLDKVEALFPKLREQSLNLVQVHDLILGTERVVEPAQLRGLHMNRHLAAGEELGHVLACTGTLGTATSGLTLGTLTTTNAGLSFVGTRSGLEIMELNSHVSPPLPW